MVTFKDISEREAHILIAALELMVPCGGGSPQFVLLNKLRSQFETDPEIMEIWWKRHADTFIRGVEEAFEEDYESYLEENSFEIARMERYEAWRNEY